MKEVSVTIMSMRYLTVLILAITLAASEVAFASTPAFPQTQTSAQEKAANLRAQLSEVETKQTGLQTRLEDLDEKLKPENIEKAFAGVGSTHPEDLREQRRRQLEIERNGVQKQLDLLATSRTRLETAIAKADADAYRQSAQPVTIAPVETTSASDSASATTPQRPRRVRKKKAKRSKRTSLATPISAP
jgi:Skp family chaperone for outer membrane proteins